MTDERINFGVNLNVSDIFQQTQAIRQAIELSAKQAFTSPTFSDQFAGVASQLQPIQYAQPSFVRVMDPYAQQREGIVQRTLNSLPSQIYTPPDIDPNVYQYQARQDFENRVLGPAAAAGIAGAGTLGVWGIMQGALNRVGWPTKVEAPVLFPTLRRALGMNTAAKMVSPGERIFGWGGLSGFRTGWLASAGRLGTLGRAGTALAMGAPPLALFMAAQSAVDYTTDEFINEIQTRSTVRDIGLEAMGPDTSTAPGGRGFTREQIEDVSQWTRNIVRSTGIKNPQMLGIMEFAATTGQYTGAQNVQQIKKKTLDILKSLGDIAKESRASLEEVMGYARDMAQMGFTPGTAAFTGFTRQVSSAARWTGMQGREVMGMATMGAEMYRGTGINMSFGANAMVQALPMIQQMRSLGILSPELVAQMGGTTEALARQTAINQQSFIMSQKGTVMLAGLAGSGGVGAYLAGQTGLGAVVGAAGGIGSNLPAVANFMMNQGKMWGAMDPMQITQVQGKMVDQMLGMAGMPKTAAMFEYAAMNIFPGQFRSPMEAELFYKQYKMAPILRTQRLSTDTINALEADVARSRTVFSRAEEWIKQEMNPANAPWWSPAPGLAIGAGAGLKFARNILSGAASNLYDAFVAFPSDIWHKTILGEGQGPVTTASDREAFLERYRKDHAMPGTKQSYSFYGQIGAGMTPDTATAGKITAVAGVEEKLEYVAKTQGFSGVRKFISETGYAKDMTERQKTEVTLGVYKQLGLDTPGVKSSKEEITKEYKDLIGKVSKAEESAAKAGYDAVKGKGDIAYDKKDAPFWLAMNESARARWAAKHETDPAKKEKLWAEAREAEHRAKGLNTELFGKLTPDGQVHMDPVNLAKSVVANKEYAEAIASGSEKAPDLAFRTMLSAGTLSAGQYRLVSKVLGGAKISEKEWKGLLADPSLAGLKEFGGDYKKALSAFGTGVIGKKALEMTADMQKEAIAAGTTPEVMAMGKQFKEALETATVHISWRDPKTADPAQSGDGTKKK